MFWRKGCRPLRAKDRVHVAVDEQCEGLGAYSAGGAMNDDAALLDACRAGVKSIQRSSAAPSSSNPA